MDLSLFLPERSIEDIFGERIRLVIGGEEYALPALTIEQNEAWLETVEAQTAGLLSAIEGAGNDLGSVFQALREDTGPMFDLLETYDIAHVLPTRDVLRSALTPIGLIRTVLMVWRAANPKADITLAMLAESLTPSSSKPRRTSSRRRSGAGQVATSGPN